MIYHFLCYKCNSDIVEYLTLFTFNKEQPWNSIGKKYCLWMLSLCYNAVICLLTWQILQFLSPITNMEICLIKSFYFYGIQYDIVYCISVVGVREHFFVYSNFVSMSSINISFMQMTLKFKPFPLISSVTIELKCFKAVSVVRLWLLNFL